MNPRLFVRMASVGAGAFGAVCALLLAYQWGIPALLTAIAMQLGIAVSIFLGELARRTPE